jgi:hypothetical protein
MTVLRRWAIRIGTALGITLGLWVVALVSSTIPAVIALSTDVHGLSLADYRVTPLHHFAPLSNRVIQDVQQDLATAGASPIPTATPSATSLPGPVPTPTPSVLPSATATPPPPLPSLPPLPSASVLPLPSASVLPLPTPTPTVLPMPTPTLPPPPPLP